MEQMEERLDRLFPQQADTEEAMDDQWSHPHYDQVFSDERAIEDLIVAQKILYLDLKSKAKTEIASAEKMVQQTENTLKKVQSVEKTMEKARETGVVQAAIKGAEAAVKMARRELEVKRRDWAAMRVKMLHIIDNLGDKQYGWP